MCTCAIRLHSVECREPLAKDKPGWAHYRTQAHEETTSQEDEAKSCTFDQSAYLGLPDPC